MRDMKRREFITLLGGVAAWPLAVSAQQPATPVVGFLRSGSLIDVPRDRVTAFREGLKEAGFVEGQNVVIEYRSAEDQAHRLPALVADSLRQQVTLIVGNTPSTVAAEAATTTVPIVFVTGGDPVTDGLVASLNRPGSNLTGVSFLSGASGTKRLELLRQLVPKAAAIAVLVDPNPNIPQAKRELRDVQAAAHASGQELIIVEAGSDRDIEAAFATFAQLGRRPASARRVLSNAVQQGMAQSAASKMPFSAASGMSGDVNRELTTRGERLS